jgi:hypothetical protein
MKIASAPSTAWARSVVKDSRPPRHSLEQRVEPGLVDRDLARLQHLDLLRVLVDADDLVPEVRKHTPETSPT